jgi:hypothetical protein
MRWVVNCHQDHAARYIRVLSDTQRRPYVQGWPEGHSPLDSLHLRQWGIIGIYTAEDQP